MLTYLAAARTTHVSTSTRSGSTTISLTASATTGSTSSRTQRTALSTISESYSEVLGEGYSLSRASTTRETTRRANGANSFTDAVTVRNTTSSRVGSGFTTSRQSTLGTLTSGTASGSTSEASYTQGYTFSTGTTSSETVEANTIGTMTDTATRIGSTTVSTTKVTGTTTASTTRASTAVATTTLVVPVVVGGATGTSILETLVPYFTTSDVPAAQMVQFFATIYEELRPCHFFRLLTAPVTSPMPLCQLPTDTRYVDTPEIGTWTTTASRTTGTTNSVQSSGETRAVGVTSHYQSFPNAVYGTPVEVVNGGVAGDVPRYRVGFAAMRDYGIGTPVGGTWTIHVATSVTDTLESALRGLGQTADRLEEAGLTLVNTLSTDDTLSLLSTSAQTTVLPFDLGPTPGPGGGVPDENFSATVTYQPGIYLRTIVTRSSSTATTTTHLVSQSSVLGIGFAHAVRSVPALFPNSTFTSASPATYTTGIDSLSSFQETRTGLFTQLFESECQQAWPEIGDDDIDGIFDLPDPD